MDTHHDCEQKLRESIEDEAFVLPFLEKTGLFEGGLRHSTAHADLAEATDVVDAAGTRVSLRGMPFSSLGFSDSFTLRLCRVCGRDPKTGGLPQIHEFRSAIDRNERCRDGSFHHSSNEFAKLRKFGVKYHFHYFVNRQRTGIVACTLVDLPAFFEAFDADRWGCLLQERAFPAPDKQSTPFVNLRVFQPNSTEKMPYVLGHHSPKVINSI
jgi:hypothetical protein